VRLKSVFHIPTQIHCSSVSLAWQVDSTLVKAEGRGKLLDANTVEVELANGGKRTIRTKHILIATGGKPVKAPIPGSVTFTSCIHFGMGMQTV
jgi:pyruvate/2-oxoglutarate dehydrogenase complex dihydrolipoamide dehydrogenase (E3) component